jgi:hypothetical protein
VAAKGAGAQRAKVVLREGMVVANLAAVVGIEEAVVGI